MTKPLRAKKIGHRSGLTDAMLTELSYLFEIEAGALVGPFNVRRKVTRADRAEAERLRYVATAITLRRHVHMSVDEVFDEIAARYAADTDPGEAR